MERKVVSMPSMYGRANPKPEPPSFDAEDMRKMRDANEMTVMRLRAADADAAKRIAGMSSDIPGTRLESSAAWSDIAIPASLGFDHGQTKWRQNQTFVEIFVALPGNARRATDVSIDLQSDFLSVKVGETSVINGSLFRPVKAEASTWIISDGVLEISLLKRYRRGNYENGKSNADTFWYSLCADGGGVGAIKLQLDAPPNAYYESEYHRDPEDNEPPKSFKKVSSGGGKRK